MKQALRWAGVLLLGIGGMAQASNGPAGSFAENDLDGLIDETVLADGRPTQLECREDLPEHRRRLCPDAQGLRAPEDIPAGQLQEPSSDELNSLDAMVRALAEARAGIRPSATGQGSRSTFRSFPLAQLESGNLDNISLGGLLPINASQLPRLTLNPNLLFVGLMDSEARQINDGATIVVDRALMQSSIFGTILLLGGDGYSRLSADVSSTPNGLNLVISADLVTTIGIVDSDGLSNTQGAGTGFDPAGAAVLGPLRVTANNLNVALRGDSSSAQLLAYVAAPDSIRIDLSGTRLGAADAFADASAIGAATPFLYLDGALQIAPGMTLSTRLQAPDENTPLLTLNGRIGEITMGRIRLTDNNSGGELSIGATTVSGIELVNTRVFFVNDTIVVDPGSGMRNISLALERVALGSTAAGFLGDFYSGNSHLQTGRITFSTH